VEVKQISTPTIFELTYSPLVNATRTDHGTDRFDRLLRQKPITNVLHGCCCGTRKAPPTVEHLLAVVGVVELTDIYIKTCQRTGPAVQFVVAVGSVECGGVEFCDYLNDRLQVKLLKL